MFKKLAFCRLTLEISLFKVQYTKISCNMVFCNCDKYHSEVNVGVNIRFGKMTLV